MNVGDILISFISEGYWSMMEKGSELLTPFKMTYGGLLGLSVAIYGVLIITKHITSSGKDLLITIVWAMFGVGLMDAEVYNNLIVIPFHTVKNNLSIFMAPGSGATVFESIQASFAGLMGYGMSLIDSGSILTNLMPIVIGGTVMFVSGLYYITIVANLLFCEMALYLLYFLGMFIIPLGAFKSARPMVKSWVKSIAKYGLVFVITGTLVGLINAAMRPLLQEVLNQSYQNGGYGDGISSIYLACVITLSSFGCYLMIKAMEFSAELTGGVMSDGAAGTTSISNAVKNTARSLNNLKGNAGQGIQALKAMRTK